MYVAACGDGLDACRKQTDRAGFTILKDMDMIISMFMNRADMGCMAIPASTTLAVPLIQEGCTNQSLKQQVMCEGS